MTSWAFGRAWVLATAALLIAATATGSALADDTVSLGTFKDWTAWKGTDANGLICYISATPQDSQPTGANRDPIHFLVIHRKGLGTRNEVQTLVGYPLKDPSEPSVAIDGKAYPMIVMGSAAWLASTNDEVSFVENMKRGGKMVVKGTSKRGTDTTDTYSLSGATAAMTEIDKACA